MSGSDPKAVLQRYLQAGRDAIVWKLDGLGEYDVRRPLVRTGTNLLGFVKHLAGVEAGYLGATFGRPFPLAIPWMDDDAERNADLWARPDETREELVELYRRVWAHGDETIAELDLDAPGRVPWWSPEHAEVTLHRILVHVATETHRHAGHADLVRELIDGAAGMRPGDPNIESGDDASWRAHHDRVEEAAREAAGEGVTDRS
ncbi:MAG: DinB family protein [Nitriliruptor sp.]|uniref:DinB family protein n=1 Tax=Nitriliruptor sp. TaxID=2448056 RepID=UPI0034A070BA